MNRNGTIDPLEQATLYADRATAVTATSSASSGDEVVSLSPFQVVSDNRGYVASNTMSGTRLNSKIEDLAELRDASGEGSDTSTKPSAFFVLSR